MDRLNDPLDVPQPSMGDRVRQQWAEALGYLPHAGVVFIGCLGIWILKKLGFLTGLTPALHLPVLLALLIALAPVRAAAVDRPLRVVHRTIVLLFTVYAVAAYPTVTEAYTGQSLYAHVLLLYGGWIALAGGLLAWWRPGFGLVPVLIIAWKKHLLQQLYGFPLNATDYYPVAELGVFVCIAIGLVATTETVAARRGRPVPGQEDGRWRLGEGVFIAALAIHLANYLYSAHAKITLPGAGFWTWVLENDTHNIMIATAAIGLGPLQSHDLLAGLGHDFMERFQVVTNLLTFCAQWFALFCLLRIRWAVLLTAFYDAMHLMIFVTTSILFWKWMTLNAGLVLALSLLRGRVAPPPALILMGLGVMLLSPLVFNIARLGWFDSAASNRPMVMAVTEDGQEVRVPTNFFLEGSAQLAKGRIGLPFEGHFELIGTFGKARGGYDQMLAAKTCDLEVAPKSGLSASFAREPRFERFFREHHRFILDNVDEAGHYPYNWFPHHNWSNPALFREFEALDLRRIVAYRYIIDSVCLSYDRAGGIREEIKLRGVHEVPVP